MLCALRTTLDVGLVLTSLLGLYLLLCSAVVAVPKDAGNLFEQVTFDISGPQSTGIILETIKRGEDDDLSSRASEKTIIMRVFEGLGGRARGVLNL